MTLRTPLLPAPATPPSRPCRCASRTVTGLGVLEQAERDRRGDGPAAGVARGRVGQRLGVRVGAQDPDEGVVGPVGVGLDPDGAGAGAQPGLQRRDGVDQVGGGLAGRQADAGAPAPAVDHGGHDPRAGQPDGGDDVRPGGEGALHADLGAAAPVGPPGDAADDRAGHQQQRQRRRARAVVGGGGEPPGAGEDDRDRVGALDRSQQRRDPRPAQPGGDGDADQRDRPRRDLLPVQDRARDGERRRRRRAGGVRSGSGSRSGRAARPRRSGRRGRR